MLIADTYARLPAHFYTRIGPTPVAAPELIKFNTGLAEELGLELNSYDDAALAEIFSGNRLLPTSQPIALVYAGHQFGNFVPQLGDGRAVLLAEVRDHAGQRRDIQLKGSGPTPYSRGGDGRAAMGPVLREYLVSEAMHALGLPTTRSLAAVSTGEAVYRNGRIPGAVLTRVAASHVRVGTFQFFAARGDTAAVRQLADYVIERHYPAAAGAEEPYMSLLRGVMQRQARLVAGWMSVGFIHGVMNTDNMAVSGETIDFGPCAFMDTFDPAKVFSSIDHAGRYAFANQPAAAQWNLARFAETLLPLIDADGDRAVARATVAIGEFYPAFNDEWLAVMRRKLGLLTAEAPDLELIQRLFAAMQRAELDFTVTFRALCAAADGAGGPAALDAEWQRDWLARLSREPASPGERAAIMRGVNPCYIPRNHRIEALIAAAVERGDFQPFEALSRVLALPFEERDEFAHYMAPPLAEERVLQTFCGT